MSDFICPHCGTKLYGARVARCYKCRELVSFDRDELNELPSTPELLKGVVGLMIVGILIVVVTVVLGAPWWFFPGFLAVVGLMVGIVYVSSSGWWTNLGARWMLRSGSNAAKLDAALRLQGSTVKTDLEALIDVLEEREVGATAAAVLKDAGWPALPLLKRRLKHESDKATRARLREIIAAIGGYHPECGCRVAKVEGSEYKPAAKKVRSLAEALERDLPGIEQQGFRLREAQQRHDWQAAFEKRSRPDAYVESIVIGLTYDAASGRNQPEIVHITDVVEKFQIGQRSVVLKRRERSLTVEETCRIGMKQIVCEGLAWGQNVLGEKDVAQRL